MMGWRQGATCGYYNSLLIISTQSLEHLGKYSKRVRIPWETIWKNENPDLKQAVKKKNQKQIFDILKNKK